MVMVVAEGAGQGLVPASFSDVGIWLNDKIKVRKKMIKDLQKLKLKIHHCCYLFSPLGEGLEEVYKRHRNLKNSVQAFSKESLSFQKRAVKLA